MQVDLGQRPASLLLLLKRFSSCGYYRRPLCMSGGAPVSGFPRSDILWSPAETQHAIVYYYLVLYPATAVERWLQLPWSSCRSAQVRSRALCYREISVTLGSGVYIRYQSVPMGPNPSGGSPLRSVLRDFAGRARLQSGDILHKLDFGAVWTGPPREHRTPSALVPAGRAAPVVPLARELVVDIDLSDYNELRACSCRGAEICRSCWPWINLAAVVLDQTFRLDYGLVQVLWVFSGRRGVHAWVSDPTAAGLTDGERRILSRLVSVVGTLPYWRPTPPYWAIAPGNSAERTTLGAKTTQTTSQLPACALDGLDWSQLPLPAGTRAPTATGPVAPRLRVLEGLLAGPRAWLLPLHLPWRLQRAYVLWLLPFFEHYLVAVHGLFDSKIHWLRILYRFCPDPILRNELIVRWSCEDREDAAVPSPTSEPASSPSPQPPVRRGPGRWTLFKMALGRLIKSSSGTGPGTAAGSGGSHRSRAALYGSVVVSLVFSYCYPRLDVNVTTHRNHLLKAPFSLHPKTFWVSIPFSLRWSTLGAVEVRRQLWVPPSEADRAASTSGASRPAEPAEDELQSVLTRPVPGAEAENAAMQLVHWHTGDFDASSPSDLVHGVVVGPEDVPRSKTPTANVRTTVPGVEAALPDDLLALAVAPTVPLRQALGAANAVMPAADRAAWICARFDPWRDGTRLDVLLAQSAGLLPAGPYPASRTAHEAAQPSLSEPPPPLPPQVPPLTLVPSHKPAVEPGKGALSPAIAIMDGLASLPPTVTSSTP